MFQFLCTYNNRRWQANKQRDYRNVGIDISTVHVSLKERNELLGSATHMHMAFAFIQIKVAREA